MAFAPVFYPGTASPSQARLVTLGPGEERTAIDFEIDYVPVARICRDGDRPRPAERRVPTCAWCPIRTRRSSARARSAASPPRPMARSRSITFRPAATLLAARASSDGSMALRYDAATSLWASTELVVDGQDIPNVILTPVPGSHARRPARLPGTTTAAETDRVRAGLGLPLSSRTSPGGSPVAQVSRGRPIQRLRRPPGTYWPDYPAGIRNPIGAWWLKSIAIDGREALDAPLTLSASTAEATVTFGDTASELRGRVAFATGEPAANCTVVVFPVERAALVLQFAADRRGAARCAGTLRGPEPSGGRLPDRRARRSRSVRVVQSRHAREARAVGREAHDSRRRDGDVRSSTIVALRFHDSHSLPAKAGSHEASKPTAWLPPSGGRLREAIHGFSTGDEKGDGQEDVGRRSKGGATETAGVRM